MSRSDVWDLAINLVGLAGVSALSVPALYASRYGRLLYKLSKLDPRSGALKAAKIDLERELNKLRDGWTSRNSALLIGGTTLAGLSYLLGIIKALVHTT